MLTWKIFGQSHSRYVTLKAELLLPSSCCKGEACLPRSHNKEELLSPKSYAKNSHNVSPPMSAYVLSFFGFYETTDVFFGSLADIDGHYKGTLESGLWKPKKYFRLIMIRVAWNMNWSSFQKKFENFWLRKFSVRVIIEAYLWKQSSRFRDRVAKGRPAFRDRISREEPLSPKSYI